MSVRRARFVDTHNNLIRWFVSLTFCAWCVCLFSSASSLSLLKQWPVPYPFVSITMPRLSPWEPPCAPWPVAAASGTWREARRGEERMGRSGVEGSWRLGGLGGFEGGSCATILFLEEPVPSVSSLCVCCSLTPAI